MTTIPKKAIDDAFALLPPKMDGAASRVLLLAIALQESGFKSRRQYGNGPARGYWQFEASGGVIGVLAHHSTATHARIVCGLRDVKPIVTDVHAALEFDDVLAAAFARLLLWTDRHALPALGDERGAWAYYLRTWRPGKPHADRWPANYAEALRLVNTPTNED
jgi:hypothetical protein